MDLTATSARFPLPGETIIGRGFVMVPGGKGANQAVAAARQGAGTAMIGRVGTDLFGDAIRGILDAESIDRRYVGSDRTVPTGIAQITVDGKGQNVIVVVPGSNNALSAKDVEGALRALGAPRALLTQLEIPIEVVRAALSAAEPGTTRILNPSPASPLAADLLALVDLCVPNEGEAASLTGLSVADVADAAEAAFALRRRGCRAVVVTLGPRGSVYVDDSESLHVPAFPVEAIDTVAAGDAYCGVLAAALAAGLPIEQALVRASAGGALAATIAGATSSLPRTKTIDRLIASNPAIVAAPI